MDSKQTSNGLMAQLNTRHSEKLEAFGYGSEIHG
jgi:hypothetical protein